MNVAFLENLVWLYAILLSVFVLGLVICSFITAWCSVDLVRAIVRWIDAKTRNVQIETELGRDFHARQKPASPDDSRYLPKK